MKPSTVMPCGGTCPVCGSLGPGNGCLLACLQLGAARRQAGSARCRRQARCSAVVNQDRWKAWAKSTPRGCRRCTSAVGVHRRINTGGSGRAGVKNLVLAPDLCLNKNGRVKACLAVPRKARACVFHPGPPQPWSANRCWGGSSFLWPLSVLCDDRYLCQASCCPTACGGAWLIYIASVPPHVIAPSPPAPQWSA